MSRRNIELPIEELVARYEAGESTYALGRAYGVGWSTVLGRLVGAGVEMRASGAPLGNRYGLKRGGALFVNTGGYLGTLDRGGRQCRIHRGCWEAYHGAIADGQVVHHVNADVLDNAIENLACMSRSEHMRLHREG